MSEISETNERAEQLLPIESLKVGKKLTITAIPLRRRPNPLSVDEGEKAEALKEAISNVIEEADGVIFEYFPKEITRLASSPFFGRYRGYYESVMDFFVPLADQTKDYKKTAYVLDPAYDEKFTALFHELPGIISDCGLTTAGLATEIGAISALSLIFRLMSGEFRGKRESEEKKEAQGKSEGRKFTRKQFLGGLVGIGAGGAATLVSTKYVTGGSSEVVTGTPSSSRFPNENKFRRAIIAKGISQISENLDKDSSEGQRNLVLLYPPLHWKGIKELFADRKRLDEEFDLYSSLKQIGLKDAFFTARKYQWTGNEWNLEKAEIGGNPGPTV